jgi:hypothetical protein
LQIRERCALSLPTIVLLGFGSIQAQRIMACLRQTQQQLLAISHPRPSTLGIV